MDLCYLNLLSCKVFFPFIRIDYDNTKQMSVNVNNLKKKGSFIFFQKFLSDYYISFYVGTLLE